MEEQNPSATNRNWRKSEVIAAAAQCFMERGYHAAKIDDVAALLGCSKGRIYHHCASKLDLFIEVHREGMNRLFNANDAALKEAAHKGANGIEALEIFLLAHARAMLENIAYETVVVQGVELYRFATTTADQRAQLDEIMRQRSEFERRLTDHLKAAIKDGTMRKHDVSITAKVLLGGLQWTIIWYRPRENETKAARNRLAAKMVAPLIDGLRA
ncbi:MAG: AcrR family transcriptional regulator [Halocynthiibacter sp.]|jgi:AcrR family transcriptional regulator